jgi:phosphoenolpyruvate-protein phosphotransferase (PTS system enzyme I)
MSRMSEPQRNGCNHPLPGATASPGIAKGVAFVFTRPDPVFTPRTVTDPHAETLRLNHAVEEAKVELILLKERVLDTIGEKSAHIFRAQHTILEDEPTLDEIRDLVARERIGAETAVSRIFTHYRELFESLANDVGTRERAVDLEDVEKRLIRLLLGEETPSLDRIVSDPGDHIVIARELLPSDTATMHRDRIRGIVTERGGITSHVAILARNLGIPAAVAVRNATSLIHSGDTIVLDGTDPERALVYRNPGPSMASELQRRISRFGERRILLEKEKDLIPETRDGEYVDVAVNIGTVEDIPPALAAGARSVGLFRSEHLFINSDRIPDEETQYRTYRATAESFPRGFVILRTLDVGADKQAPAIPIPPEDNPFLGYRGVRVTLDREDLFKTQLRAILRAAVYGRLRLMVPMVSGPDEVRRVRNLLAEVRAELHREGTPFSDVDFGIMIEIPSTILMMEELAKEVDFFSIGTNDLTQYLLATDRTNEQVRDYYQLYHPSVFRSIRIVVEAAHARNRQVGVCGELGGMPPAIPLLVGLGVDILSMGSQSLAEAIHVIRRVDSRDARELARQVLAMSEASQVTQALREFGAGRGR